MACVCRWCGLLAAASVITPFSAGMQAFTHQAPRQGVLCVVSTGGVTRRGFVTSAAGGGGEHGGASGRKKCDASGKVRKLRRVGAEFADFEVCNCLELGSESSNGWMMVGSGDDNESKLGNLLARSYTQTHTYTYTRTHTHTTNDG